MDFFKKHWEKVLLTVALLSLIAVGVWLMSKIDSLQQEVNGPTLRPSKGEAVPAINKTPYTNSLAHLEAPLQWIEMPQNPFEHPWEPPPPPTSVVEHAEFPVTLWGIKRVPFWMLFKAYTWDGGKKAAGTFQLDLASRPLTFFVAKVGDPVANRFENTGFVATNFERIITNVFSSSLGSFVDKDVSILTIQRPKERPLPLTLGEVATEQEPVATMACDPGWPAKRVTYQVRRGQKFECGGVTYIVVDITVRQVIIKNANKPEEKPITIELSTSPASRTP